MTFRPVLAALIIAAAGTGGAALAAKRAPLTNPVFLNIGFVCQWQDRCVQRQQKAMKRALRHVKARKVPTWKIQRCNRNASRQRGRVDWIGFDNCVRNPRIRR